MKTPRTVLISGAGIAGPAAAHWLTRAGMQCTVVERAPALRTGGQAVDFRGPVHRVVLEKMNLWDAIHAQQTHQGEHQMIDEHGAVQATLAPQVFSGDVEILRGDLSALLVERTPGTEYVFGDGVTELDERADGVRVSFERSPARSFDLVVGADGLHSRVRGLAFGHPPGTLRHHGHRVAGFSCPNFLGLRGHAQTFSRPGRSVSIAASRDGQSLRVLFCFRGDPIAPGMNAKVVVAGAFEGMGWHVPALLDAMRAAPDLYFDAISTVHVPSAWKGRVALVGDAAFGGTLGGQGTPLAIIGAYVLAGELSCHSDLRDALDAYDRRLRPYALKGQNGAKHVGGFHAPSSAGALWMRNAYLRFFSTRVGAKIFEKLFNAPAADFALPEYPALDQAASRASRAA